MNTTTPAVQSTRWLKQATCLFLALLLLPAAVMAKGDTTNLTFSVWVPQTHVLVKDFMKPWAKQVEEATEGRVQIRFLPKPITNAKGHYNAVRKGIVDLAFISFSYYPGRFQLTEFSMFPFHGHSAEASSVAAWRVYDEYLKSVIKTPGVVILGTFNHGPGTVFTNGAEVTDIDDFKGLKIRVGGGMAADVADTLGVNAVAKPAPMSYQLLSTGVVDGVFFPLESIKSFHLTPLIKEATIFPSGLYSDMLAIIINKKTLEQLSDADRKALLSVSGEHIAHMGGGAWGAADVAGLKDLIASDAEIHIASQQLVDAIKQSMKPFTQEWLDMAESKGVDGKELLNAFDQELEKLESGQHNELEKLEADL